MAIDNLVLYTGIVPRTNGEQNLGSKNKKWDVVNANYINGYTIVGVKKDENEDLDLTNCYANGSTVEGFNNSVVGIYSHAEGNSVEVMGEGAHAEGYRTRATGDYSHAEGYDDRLDDSIFNGTIGAYGDYSHSEGFKTTAYNCAHAEGKETTAWGENSHAEGDTSTANGENSHVEGYHSFAGGESSHAEGSGTTAGEKGAHAEGRVTLAQGIAAHAEGNYTKATENGAHSEGYSDNQTLISIIASGIGSHAEGYASDGEKTQAEGKGSHAEGYNTRASGESSHAEGYLTVAAGKSSHASGAKTIASADYSHAEGYHTIATGNAAHSEGLETQASGIYSHAEGIRTKAVQRSAHAEGDCIGYKIGVKVKNIMNAYAIDPSRENQWVVNVEGNCDDLNVGDYIKFLKDDNLNDFLAEDASLLFDISADDTLESKKCYQIMSKEASNDTANLYIPKNPDDTTFELSFIDGSHTWQNLLIIRDNLAQGIGSHVEGGGNQALGRNSHAEGVITIAKSLASHSEGYNTLAQNTASHAEGVKTQALAGGSHAEGVYTKAVRRYQHVFGCCNRPDTQGNSDSIGKYIEIVGNGTFNGKTGEITSNSNARTLDWSGNQWNAGNIIIGPRDPKANDNQGPGSQALRFEYNKKSAFGSSNGGNENNLGYWSIWAVYKNDGADNSLYFGRKPPGGSQSWKIFFDKEDKIHCQGTTTAGNDYAEYRKCNEEIAAGHVVAENGDGTLSLSTKRLQKGCEIVSDTFGSSLRPNEEYNLPIATAGRVLAYPDKEIKTFEIGSCVCAGENGTVSQMTEEEERLYPGRILGTVSEIPTYKVWKNGNEEIQVDGRIWIRVR